MSRGGAWMTGRELAALTGLFLAGFLAFGIGVYAFTQFLNPVQAEFGWNRTVLGGLMSAFWIAAPFVLLAAYALDVLGLRVIVFGGAVIEAAGLVFMTHLSSPTEFFVVRFAMGVGKCLIVTPVPIAAARWFHARTGLACAVALSGWHFGGLLMAPLTAAMIASMGWRTSALVLAALLLGGMTLATWLLRPPPARAARAEAADAAPAKREPEVAHFAHPWVLALIAVGTLVYYAGYATFLSQLSPILKDIGLDTQSIGRATGSMAIFAALGTLLGGLGTQALPAHRGVGALLLMMAALEYGAIALHPGASALAVGALVIPLGLVIGGGDPVIIDALRRCTPPRHYNKSYGWWYLACLASLAVTPVLAGLYFDRHGSYRGLFLMLAAATVANALLWLVTTRRTRASLSGPTPAADAPARNALAGTASSVAPSANASARPVPPRLCPPDVELRTHG